MSDSTAAETIRQLGIARKALIAYPPAHPELAAALERAHRPLADLLDSVEESARVFAYRRDGPRGREPAAGCHIRGNRPLRARAFARSGAPAGPFRLRKRRGSRDGRAHHAGIRRALRPARGALRLRSQEFRSVRRRLGAPEASVRRRSAGPLRRLVGGVRGFLRRSWPERRSPGLRGGRSESLMIEDASRFGGPDTAEAGSQRAARCDEVPRVPTSSSKAVCIRS
jgi:hypothetical protein